MEERGTTLAPSSSPPPNFLYFAHQEQDRETQVKQAFEATLARNARRQFWLAERRKDLRDAARRTVVERRLQYRTEQLAARWSNDPSLATGRRSAARTHAEARKILVDRSPFTYVPKPYQGPLQPVQQRISSVSSVAVLAEHKRAHPDSIFIDWSEIVVPHSKKWVYAGKEYSIEEIRKVMTDKFAIADEYQTRMNKRKVFLRSMDVAMETFRHAMSLLLRGAWVYTPFNILPPLPKARPTRGQAQPSYASRWDRPSIVAMAWGHTLRDRKRLAALTGKDEFSMEIDAEDGWPLGIDGNVIAPHNVAWAGGWLDLRNITVAAFNAETMQRCGDLCRSMTVEQLKFWRTHLSQLREQGQGHVSKDKWSALNKAISQQERQRKDVWGQQGMGDPWAQPQQGGPGPNGGFMPHHAGKGQNKGGRKNNKGGNGGPPSGNGSNNNNSHHHFGNQQNQGGRGGPNGGDFTFSFKPSNNQRGGGQHGGGSGNGNHRGAPRSQSHRGNQNGHRGGRGGGPGGKHHNASNGNGNPPPNGRGSGQGGRGGGRGRGRHPGGRGRGAGRGGN